MNPLLAPLRWRTYWALVLAFALAGGLSILLRNVTLGKDAMFRCDPTGLDGNNYISYCDAVAFAEYDLGAHYFGLEPRMISAMKKADVLFLGNSRTGHSFSTRATQEAMASLGVEHYYVAGFGYEGTSHFATTLIKQYDLHPKVIIVNADPFFSDDNNVAYNTLTSGKASIYFDYLTKKYFQRIQWYFCTITTMACGSRATVYRTYDHGFWQITKFEERTLAEQKLVPFTEPDDLPEARLRSTENYAHAFIEAIPTKPECIVLTSIPSPHSTRRIAEAVAKKFGFPFFAPILDGLKTYDQSHLDSKDSERWSEIMLAQAQSTIKKCL